MNGLTTYYLELNILSTASKKLAATTVNLLLKTYESHKKKNNASFPSLTSCKIQRLILLLKTHPLQSHNPKPGVICLS